VPVRFQKRFTVDKQPVTANVQVFAINHAILSINDQEIGWVQFRNTLSCMILDRCVKAWDITSHIKQGENLINVAVTNNTRSWHLINVYLEITFADGTMQRVLSDPSWTCDTGANDRRGFEPVKSLGAPPSVIGCLTVPDLVNGGRSHFTRMLGMVVEIVPRIPKWLLPLLIAIAKAAKMIA
jgi:hypothetical protein